MKLSDINIVLSHTTHAGNIGATARAMKTMGLSSLVLINPKNYPSTEATTRASRADDILQNAKVVTTIDEALANSHWVVGTSARQRRHDAPLLTPRELAEKVAASEGQTFSIVFGTENSGLTNEELSRCHNQVFIPANPEYSSLNLASAVQLICYELRMQWLEGECINSVTSPEHNPVSAELMQGFYAHLLEAMTDTGYLNPKQPKQLEIRLRRMFNRMSPDDSEYQILRGFLTSIERITKP
ncbi:MAG: RNA methyltransferase [Enterobacterales bacterium]|nr:RNA methyltransferase [Enterobacterales bacterium]